MRLKQYCMQLPALVCSSAELTVVFGVLLDSDVEEGGV